VRKIQRLAAVGAMATMTVLVGACSSAQEPSTGTETPPPVNEPATEPTSEVAAPTGSGVTQISDIFGPSCSQVPPDGEGSAQGMVDDPVATAASNNPLLTTLTTAVTAAKLGDTLNSAPSLTVFAPADAAFQAMETQNPGTLNQLTTAPDVAQPTSKLSTILTYHVVGQRYDAEGIVAAGTLDSLQGGKLQIGGTAAAPTVNGAPVLCGNIPTKNATVFVIGQVLSPPAA
jgi:uncharacterized surface protein with fasciclin (FAS1) repeats